jgi:hypothetical protein
VLARVIEKKVAQGNARGSESVRFDDIGARFEEPAMNVADELGLCEGEEISAIEHVLAGIPESIGTDVPLRHPVGANGRAHGAIEDGDPFFEQSL